MSCAKHKFFDLNPEFVHKVVHNFVQCAGIWGKSAFWAFPAVDNAERMPA